MTTLSKIRDRARYLTPTASSLIFSMGFLSCIILSQFSHAQEEQFARRAELLNNVAVRTLPAEFSELRYQSKTLTNGMTVVAVHNSATPEVLIEIYQKAGSVDEWKGVAGIAHLHEHLMFKGDEHFSKVSGHSKGVNAATSRDSVVYTEIVRKDALEATLHTEADRYINFFETLTDEIIQTQKQVVRNEMLQRRGGLYGNFMDHLLFALYGPKYPYARPVIGYENEFSAITREQIQTWHSYAYDPAKTIIVLNGDVSYTRAFELVEKYFGALPSTRSKPSKLSKKKVKRSLKPVLIELEHNIPGSLLVVSVLGPAPGTDNAVSLDFLCQLFNGELYNQKLLNIDDVTNAGCFTYKFLESQPMFFYLELSKNNDPKVIFKQFQKVFSQLNTKPLHSSILLALKGKFIGNLIRGFEEPYTQSDLLSTNIRKNRDRNFPKILESYYKPTHDSMRKALMKAMRTKVAILYIRGNENAILPDIGYSKKFFASFPKKVKPWVNLPTLPAVDEVKGIEKIWQYQSDNIETRVLSNGAKVNFLAPHQAHNLNSFVLVKTSSMGTMYDPKDQRGLHALTMSLVGNAGTKLFPPAQIEIFTDNLGATTGTFTDKFDAGMYMNVPTHNLFPAIHLLGHMFHEPKFDESKFENEVTRIKHSLANHKRSKGAINNLMYASLLPKEHQLGGLWSASTDPKFLEAVTHYALIERYKERVFNASAEIFVSSSASIESTMQALEESFGRYKRANPIEYQRTLKKTTQANSGIKLFALPSANQATISVGLLLNSPSYEKHSDQAALFRIGVNAFGSGFLSRLNLLLREEKGWTYGARASIEYFYQMPILRISTSVDENHVHEAVNEIVKLIEDLKGNKPLTAEEILRVKRDLLYRNYTKSVDSESLVNRYLSVIAKGWDSKQQQQYWKEIASATALSVNKQVQLALKGTPEPLFIIAGNGEKLSNVLQENEVSYQWIDFDMFE